MYLVRWVILVASLTSVTAWAQHTQTQQVIAAPSFTLKDADGKSHSLSDYKGKPLILHFWATWCPYCKKLQPGLNRLLQDSLKSDQPKDQLQILAISIREDEGAEPQKVLEQRGMDFQTLLKGENVAMEYGVRGTPTTFFIDKQGNIIAATQISEPDHPGLKRAANLIKR